MKTHHKNLKILFYRSSDNKLLKVPCVSDIPNEKLCQIDEQINDINNDFKELRLLQKSMKQESDIRKSASDCLKCNLCMVCAGDHRRYESWPPGTGKCFYKLSKGGRPLRDEPCQLCDNHDKELKNYHRLFRRNLSQESRLKNKLNSLMIQRRNLFFEYKIDIEVYTE